MAKTKFHFRVSTPVYLSYHKVAQSCICWRKHMKNLVFVFMCICLAQAKADFQLCEYFPAINGKQNKFHLNQDKNFFMIKFIKAKMYTKIQSSLEKNHFHRNIYLKNIKYKSPKAFQPFLSFPRKMNT